MDETLEELANICADPPEKRTICLRCDRPFTVCYCSSIEPVSIRSNLIVLQHPNEVKRCLRTTKIMELSLPPERYHLFRGKRFTEKKFPKLYQLLKDDGPEAGFSSVLVYPTSNAESLYQLPSISNRISGSEYPGNNNIVAYNIILLDGTWSQAKVLYNNNPFLQSLKCIKLDNKEPSRYVIRTQPTETCLSTVEAAGLVLAHLEQSSTIVDSFSKPLKTICDYQLDKGAVQHQSKEFLITNGLYNKPLNKKIQRHILSNGTVDIKDLLC